MFSGITTFLMLSQFDDGLGGLLILIVFVGLSALSSLLKRKQEKSDSTPKPKPRQPAAPQQSRQAQIPGYARKTTRVPTSQTRTPTTTPRPRPAAQKPTPSSPTRQPQWGKPHGLVGSVRTKDEADCQGGGPIQTNPMASESLIAAQ